MSSSDTPLVHVRTTAYKRPELLKRCLESLAAQTWTNWVCDVFDDDAEASGREIVAAVNDPRVTYHHNIPQRFASKNIDQCFTRSNTCDADFFCVVEDDNFLLPRFMEDNIRICRDEGVEIVFRNQLVELNSGTANARLSKAGILEGKFTGGLYQPQVFHLSLIADIGVSNGGLFWSRHAKSDLEVNCDCSSTLQEYMRTFAVQEPIFVALEPLAVWAENGEGTMRDLGAKAGYYRSELSLKRSVRILQRHIWDNAPSSDKKNFLHHAAFAYPVEMRARGLVKSHIQLDVGKTLSLREKARLVFRGAIIRTLGQPDNGLQEFIDRYST
ncbi:MAG: glycosyltransferase family A protein [Sulfitobacter sp.]